MPKDILNSISKAFSKPDSQDTSVDQPTTDIEEVPVQSGPSDFEELHLPEELLKAITKLGFTACTPVQKEVLPHALDGEDVIAKAQTGTGKTAAFLIAVIAYHEENPELEPRPKGSPFALVVAPTRELALQITEDAKDLSRYVDFNVLALVGGIDYEKQKQAAQKQVDLVVATPGRLLDFCRSSNINLGMVEQLVIDEADRMLGMGFIPDLKQIIRRTPRKEQRQTLLFSATYNEDVLRLSEQWTREPVQIEIEPNQVAVDSVEQLVYLTGSDEKYALLYNLITNANLQRVIVFVNRRDQASYLENKLYRHDIASGLLTGDVPQKKRLRTLDDFKSGKIRILVATDVAGRGIHIDDVSHVVNYTLPEDPEDYVHRIGRTGRAGAKGISVSFACETDSFQLPFIEALLGNKLECLTPEDELLVPAPPPVRSGRPKMEKVKRRPSRR